MRRMIRVEVMEAMADMRTAGEQTPFSTAEIAGRLGIEAWRVRRSLKSMAADEVTLVWSDGNDKWCIDPRLVRLPIAFPTAYRFRLLSGIP
jgi:DNA-binding IclR family transcriptional regulator